MDVTFDFSDVMPFFEEGKREVASEVKSIGEESVEYAKSHGSYQNRTGHLRASNKYRANESGLTIYNDADYASDVEQRGYDVISGAALFAETRLKEEFEQ